MKNSTPLLVTILLFASLKSLALTPKNQCGRGNKILAAYSCADAKTGGSFALGAFVICSQMKNGKNLGYTVKLDDNVVAYGGGNQWGEISRTLTHWTLTDGTETDVLDLRTGFAKIQHEKMKCSVVKN